MREKIERQLKTPLKKHDNLASLLMEILPEEYKKIKEKELKENLIIEDSLEAIYGDGKQQVLARISPYLNFLKLENEPILRDVKKKDI